MKITKSQLTKVIREAIVKNVKQYITEQQQQQGAGLKQRITAKTAGTKDQVSIDKLMMALDGMEKGGKKAVSFDDLVAIAKKSIEVAAPLGKGSAQGLAQRATSKTGAAPVTPPPANLGQARPQEAKKTDGEKLDEAEDDVAAGLDKMSNLPEHSDDDKALSAALHELNDCMNKVQEAILIAEEEELDEEEQLVEVWRNLKAEQKVLIEIINNSERFVK